MTRFYALDANGEAVPEPDMLKAMSSYSDPARVVGRDEIGDVVVSTVFLAVDHGRGNKPKIFETMIFGGKFDGYQDRWATRAEALAGHLSAVTRVKIGF